MSTTPATSVQAAHPAVTAATGGGFVAGLLTALAGLAGSLTGHGTSLADALIGLSGGGISATSLLGLVSHHNKTLDHAAAALYHDAASGAQWARDHSAELEGVLAEAKQLVNSVDPALLSGIEGRVKAVEDKVASVTGGTVTAADIAAEVRRALGNLGQTPPAPTSAP